MDGRARARIPDFEYCIWMVARYDSCCEIRVFIDSQAMSVCRKLSRNYWRVGGGRGWNRVHALFVEASCLFAAIVLCTVHLGRPAFVWATALSGGLDKCRNRSPHPSCNEH